MSSEMSKHSSRAKARPEAARPDPSRRPPAAPNKAAADSPRADRRLRAVPDLPSGDDTAPSCAYVYAEPDVIGLDRKRAEYLKARPGITDEELDSILDLYESHLSPSTVKTYVSALVPFYKYAEAHGFHPLRCEAADIEAYLLHLMMSGKLGAGGGRDPRNPYSPGYFKKFLAALKCAAEAAGLPDPGSDVDIRKLTRAYTRKRGSELPRNGRTELLVDELAEMERRAREGSTMQAAMPRAAIALGCDPDLGLTVSELCGLTFADVALSRDRARVTTFYRGTAADTSIIARPGDPACPVAALHDLRSAVHRRMRASRKGRAPTDKQIGAEHLFSNAHTGEPLSRQGLRKMVAKAWAGLPGIPEAETGRLPALSASQRRRAIDAAMDVKTIRDLALVFYSVYASSRVGETSKFRVCDVDVFGEDIDGMDIHTPLVGQTDPDGTYTEGVIDRVAEVTETDLLDCDGRSLYESGLVVGARNLFCFGTKTQERHKNWASAQPGHPACPLRLLVLWLKAYDRLMVDKHGRRLAPDDPLFTNLRNPGEPIADMSQALSGIVKAAVADLGINPEKYSGHSLRKTRYSYVLSQGGSMTEAMVHDGRSSEAAGLVYAHRNPRRPFDGDPTVDIYNKTPGTPADHPPRTSSEPRTRGTGPDDPPQLPDTPESLPLIPEGEHAEKEETGPAGEDPIAALLDAVSNLRASGVEGKTIATLANLAHAAPDTAETPIRPRNHKPDPDTRRPHRNSQRRR